MGYPNILRMNYGYAQLQVCRRCTVSPTTLSYIMCHGLWPRSSYYHQWVSTRRWRAHPILWRPVSFWKNMDKVMDFVDHDSNLPQRVSCRCMSREPVSAAVLPTVAIWNRAGEALNAARTETLVSIDGSWRNGGFLKSEQPRMDGLQFQMDDLDVPPFSETSKWHSW